MDKRELATQCSRRTGVTVRQAMAVIDAYAAILRRQLADENTALVHGLGSVWRIPQEERDYSHLMHGGKSGQYRYSFRVSSLVRRMEREDPRQEE